MFVHTSIPSFLSKLPIDEGNDGEYSPTPDVKVISERRFRVLLFGRSSWKPMLIIKTTRVTMEPLTADGVFRGGSGRLHVAHLQSAHHLQ